MRVNAFEYAKLACHVVRFRRYGTHRCAAQHILFPARTNQIREVGMASRKLLQRNGSPVQILGERCGVKLFAGPDWGCVGVWRHGDVLKLSAIPAVRLRWCASVART